MKILIAYDGSECSDAAIVDLRRAGLPAIAEVMVLSVAELPLQMAQVPYDVMACGRGMLGANVCEPSSDELLQEAQNDAAQAADRLHADFPQWKISTEAWADAAGASILRKARGWNPDLIVLGSHGRSGLSRFILGSVSQYVLHNASCSVRISRHHLHSQERTIRVLIGVDGSDNARAAVQAVAARSWPVRTETCVLGVLDSRIAIAAAGTLDGAIPVTIEDEARGRMTKAVHDAVRELAKSGLQAAPLVIPGKPDEVLLAEAMKWGADCVFVGARGLNRLERVLLGSVSSAVASRAHCSVEVIRPRLA
jgi:nucleotide-binding universal stress UspA family protein